MLTPWALARAALASASPDELTLELGKAIYCSWERAVAEDWLGQVGDERLDADVPPGGGRSPAPEAMFRCSLLVRQLMLCWHPRRGAHPCRIACAPAWPISQTALRPVNWPVP